MILLPSDVLEYTFLQMHESDVEKCRVVCGTFRNLIDKRKPYSAGEYYIKAKEAQEKIKTLIENDPILSEMQNWITTEIKEYKREEASPSWWKHCFYRPFQRRKNLAIKLRIFHSGVEIIKKMISDGHDKRAILCYKKLQKDPLVRQPIIDIFGSMLAFEKLPIIDYGKNMSAIDFPLSDKEVSHPIMRGIDGKGNIFFILRAINTENTEETKIQLFYYDRRFWSTWAEGKDIIRAEDGDVKAKHIAKIKMFIEKRGNEEWSLK